MDSAFATVHHVQLTIVPTRRHDRQCRCVVIPWLSWARSTVGRPTWS